LKSIHNECSFVNSDAVGGTLLNRTLAIYSQFHQFDRPIIDMRILGEEYRDKDFTGKEICRRRGIQIYFNKRDHRFSSTDLRRPVSEHNLMSIK